MDNEYGGREALLLLGSAVAYASLILMVTFALGAILTTTEPPSSMLAAR